MLSTKPMQVLQASALNTDLRNMKMKKGEERRERGVTLLQPIPSQFYRLRLSQMCLRVQLSQMYLLRGCQQHCRHPTGAGHWWLRD